MNYPANDPCPICGATDTICSHTRIGRIKAQFPEEYRGVDKDQEHWDEMVRILRVAGVGVLVLILIEVIIRSLP